jgi:hypothetical protein
MSYYDLMEQKRTRGSSIAYEQLAVLPKDRYYKRIDVVKDLFDSNPVLKDEMLVRWNDDRPDLGHLKSNQLMTSIAMDFLKRYDQAGGRYTIEQYVCEIRQRGAPIPKRKDKLAKYQEARNDQLSLEKSTHYDDDDEDWLNFDYPYDDGRGPWKAPHNPHDPQSQPSQIIGLAFDATPQSTRPSKSAAPPPASNYTGVAYPSKTTSSGPPSSSKLIGSSYSSAPPPKKLSAISSSNYSGVGYGEAPFKGLISTVTAPKTTSNYAGVSYDSAPRKTMTSSAPSPSSNYTSLSYAPPTTTSSATAPKSTSNYAGVSYDSAPRKIMTSTAPKTTSNYAGVSYSAPRKTTSSTAPKTSSNDTGLPYSLEPDITSNYVSSTHPAYSSSYF